MRVSRFLAASLPFDATAVDGPRTGAGPAARPARPTTLVDRQRRSGAATHAPRHVVPSTAADEAAHLAAATAQSLETARRGSFAVAPATRAEAEAQWKQAMRESRACLPAPRLPPRPSPARLRDQPLVDHLVLGNAPADEDSFLHAIRQLEPPDIERAFGRPMAFISNDDMRDHVVRHAIAQMKAGLRPGPQAAALRDRHPHLEYMLTAPPDGPLPDDATFEAVVGPEQARLCAGMTPAQRSHVFALAHQRAVDPEQVDLLPTATAAAFPGLRLLIATPELKVRNADEFAFGAAMGAPRIVYLNAPRSGPAGYVPAMLHWKP